MTTDTRAYYIYHYPPLHDGNRVLNGLFCNICQRELQPDETWLPDDTRDGRHFCSSCADKEIIRHPEMDFIRAKDLI
jgi:hypothetical protein